MLYCRDCSYRKEDGYCTYHNDVHDAGEELCPYFVDKQNLKQPLYCHLASDIDRMADYLIKEEDIMGGIGGDYTVYVFNGVRYASRKSAHKAAVDRLLNTDY